jgi:DNA primase large subunit
MEIDLDKKDLAKYPFLKEAQSIVSSGNYSFDSLIESTTGKIIIQKASERILEALSPKMRVDEVNLDFPEGEILSYAFARLIASCMEDRMIIDRLTRYEAHRAFHFLRTEDEQKKAYIALSLGIDLNSDTLPLKTYVELISSLRDSKWRLVNRRITHGTVSVEPEERNELLRERIRIALQRQLPLAVPENLCSRLEPIIERISITYQKKILEQFGMIEEEYFPPCINALIDAISQGRNIPHTGRFALTAFLHTIGMSSAQIVEIFTRAPDFDVSRTLYQVEHISGSSGTEYTPPACATMLTFGLCVNRDKICDQINHPLSYYKFRKKRKKNPVRSGEH